MEKKHLRKNIRFLLQHLSSEEIQQKSDRIATALFRTVWWQQAEIVLAFCSMKTEVDTSTMLATALEQGKIVGIPRIEEQHLVFHQLESVESQYIVNQYGIHEPAPSWPIFDICCFPSHSVLILTPGLAFDRTKKRLGRGKGFYDRFLRRTRSCHPLNMTVIGLCFSEQLLNTVPMNDDDQAVNVVITEDEMIV